MERHAFSSGVAAGRKRVDSWQGGEPLNWPNALRTTHFGSRNRSPAASILYTNKGVYGSMTDREKLTAIYDEKRANGLLHVGFTFVNTTDATADEAITELLAMEAAVARGEAKPFSFGDLRWKE